MLPSRVTGPEHAHTCRYYTSAATRVPVECKAQPSYPPASPNNANDGSKRSISIGSLAGRLNKAQRKPLRHTLRH